MREIDCIYCKSTLDGRRGGRPTDQSAQLQRVEVFPAGAVGILGAPITDERMGPATMAWSGWRRAWAPCYVLEMREIGERIQTGQFRSRAK